MEDEIELSLQLHEETKTKILVSVSGFLEDAVWLPKAKVEFCKASDDMIEARLPEALAEKHDLI